MFGCHHDLTKLAVPDHKTPILLQFYWRIFSSCLVEMERDAVQTAAGAGAGVGSAVEWHLRYSCAQDPNLRPLAWLALCSVGWCQGFSLPGLCEAAWQVPLQNFKNFFRALTRSSTHCTSFATQPSSVFLFLSQPSSFCLHKQCLTV